MKKRSMTASKKRVERAYDKGFAVGRMNGEATGQDRARREAAARYERLVLPELGPYDSGAVVWLGERPEQPVVNIALVAGNPVFPARCSRHARSEVERARFECVPMAQDIVLADGVHRVLVRWVGWKFVGLAPM